MNVIYCFKRYACLVSAFVFLVGQAAFVSAQTQELLVDFGNTASFRGLSVPNPDPNGHYWNSIQPGLLIPGMVDFHNAVTTVALGWHSGVGTDSYNGPAGPAGENPNAPPPLNHLIYTAAALGDLGVDQAVIDYAASPIPQDITDSTKCQFDLENLDPTRKYTLTFYGSHKYSNDPITTYSVFSDAAYTNLLGSIDLNVCDSADPSLHNEDQIATLNNLQPLANVGVLYVQFQGSTGNVGYLNALEIQASAPTGFVGDYNGNNKVDAADYTIWRDHLGSTTYPLANRDPNNTGAISQSDYLSWKSHFGAGGPGSGSTVGGLGGAVPEPSSIVLGVLAILGLALTKHRRA